MKEIMDMDSTTDRVFGKEVPTMEPLAEELLPSPQFDRFIPARLRLPGSILPQIVD